jgi:COP9 signalosome complex subunit 3
LGLVRQALDHAPRWTMRKLTATYVTLSLAEIGKVAGIPEEETVREIVLNMVRSFLVIWHVIMLAFIGFPQFFYILYKIELGQMDATLDVSGTVTFHDTERRFSGQEVDKMLKEAQAQGTLLGELDRELGRSKEFLSKVRKLSLSPIV